MIGLALDPYKHIKLVYRVWQFSIYPVTNYLSNQQYHLMPIFR